MPRPARLDELLQLQADEDQAEQAGDQQEDLGPEQLRALVAAKDRPQV
jgi:hypothetical protein